MQEVLIQSIVGGTQAWLGISEDEDHFVKAGKQRSGYREPVADEIGEGPFGPYHEPKGGDIEKALLQFMLNIDVDVHGRLVDRNRNDHVVCYLPFSNKDKIKVTARYIADKS